MRFHAFECEFVLQTCSWWKFPWRTWVKIDKGHYSCAVSFFWLEFFVFW
jgi:hypothetical protein